MTRFVIIAVAVLLALGAVGAALSNAEDPDPGPAITLDKDPIGDGTSGQDKGGDDRAKDDARGDHEDARVSVDGDDTFTVAHPRPVDGDDDDHDDDDRDDDHDDDDHDDPDDD
ncbi:MAG: hypothetical protein GX624_08160 [Actinobacteria bacterium]|nr:hypothetical protein [Actinomycetota bacterium]